MSIQLIKNWNKAPALKQIEATTTRTGTTRRQITNQPVIDAIQAAEPSLVFKSKSAPKAVELWAIHLFSTKMATPDARRLLRLLNKLVPTLYGRDEQAYHGTVATYKAIRNQIVDTYGIKDPITLDASKLMRVNQRMYKKIIKSYNTKVAAANRGEQKLFNDNVIYKAINKAVTSSDWREIAVGIELASGARINEILSTSTFVKAEQNNWITQTGLSKQLRCVKFKRGMTNDEYATAVEEKSVSQITSITKPVIGTTSTILLRMIADLREQLASDIDKINNNDITPYQFSQAKNKTINTVVRKMVPGATTHTLRAIYANLSYKLYGIDSGQSEAGWVSNVLGHAAGSVQVAASYTKTGVEHSSDTKQDETLLPEPVPKPIAAISLDNIPHNTKGRRDGKAGERILASITALEKAGIKPTAVILRKLGYGSSTISATLRNYVKPSAPVVIVKKRSTHRIPKRLPSLSWMLPKNRNAK